MKDLLVFFFIFSWKTDQRSIEKVWKTWSDRRIDRNRVLGTTFLAKSRFFSMILDSLGGPLERPWGGFWQEKFEEEKMTKKKSGSRLPRRVTRTPDKTLPRGFLSMVRHAFAPPWDGGRADCSGRAEAPPAHFLIFLINSVARSLQKNHRKPAEADSVRKSWKESPKVGTSFSFSVPFWISNRYKNGTLAIRKTIKKSRLQKNYIFNAIWRSRLEKTQNYIDFGMILSPQGHRFLMLFCASVLGWNLKHF